MSRRVFKCDVCYVRMQEQHVWTYEIVPFSLPRSPTLRGYDDDGAWAICPDCQPLVERKDLDTLVRRSMMLDTPEEGIEDDEARVWKSRLIGAFLKARRLRPPYRGALWAPFDGQVRHRG